MKTQDVLSFLGGFLIIGYILLLFTSSKILVKETISNDGYPTLICNYFNGRGFINKEFYYASNNFMGKDSCPFIIKGYE